MDGVNRRPADSPTRLGDVEAGAAADRFDLSLSRGVGPSNAAAGSPGSYMPVLREDVRMDAHSVVDDWDAAPFDGGFGGIDALASRGFSGAIETDGTWLFLRDGEALAVVADLDVDPRPGDIDAFEGASGRQHEAPTAGVATVAAMMALGGEVRGTYFTDDTPLSAVDETLSGGGFTGYVELSENVLSGDYYYAYVDGAVEHAAFVGSEQLLTGEEAESRAEGEVGIYDVVAVELPRPALPEPESPPEPDPTPTAAAGPEADPTPEADSGAEEDSDPASNADAAAETEPDADADDDSTPAVAADAGADTDAKPEPGLGTETEAETETEADGETEAEGETSRTPDTAEATDTDLEVDTSWLERDAEDDADAGNDDIPAGTDVEAATDESVTDDSIGDDGTGSDGEASEDGAPGDDATRDDRSGTAVAAMADDSDDNGDGDGATTASDATVEDTPTASTGAAIDHGDDARIERYEARIEELEVDLDAADSRIEELEAELETLRGERDDLRRRLESTDAPPGESMSPEAALAETRLFVRQRTRGEGALSDAHDGADREAVVSNLRIEYHTTFDDADVSVEGEPFETWLRSSTSYAFAEWLATELLFEIRSAGRPEEVRPLYDALPDVDRIGFEETIAVGDGTEGREIGFDIVARDKSGHPLVVAAFDRGRDPTYADAIEPFVDDATDVCADHDTLAGAVAITSSYFESDAMSVVREATSSSLLSRSRYRSYVKLSRANGYHLCLVEAREGSFNLTVPEL